MVREIILLTSKASVASSITFVKQIFINKRASITQNQNGMKVLYDRVSEVDMGSMLRNLLRKIINIGEFN